MTIMRHIKNKTSTMLLFLLIIMTTQETYAYGYNKTAEEYDKELKVLYKNNYMDSIKIVLEEGRNISSP